MQLPAWRLGAGCPVTRGAERVQRTGKTNLDVTGEGSVEQSDLLDQCRPPSSRTAPTSEGAASGQVVWRYTGDLPGQPNGRQLIRGRLGGDSPVHLGF